jgi:hypothetical protein
MQLLGTLQRLVQSLFGARRPSATRPATGGLAPVERRVLVLSYNPRIAEEGGRPLTEVLGWYDPVQLTQRLVAALADASFGYLRCTVVAHQSLDEWPLKADAFRYDGAGYLANWRGRGGWHQADAFDYEDLVRRHRLIERVEAGEIDEVWLWAMPFAGFWESHMAGPSAFFCNAPPMRYLGFGRRRFIIMGFNYQRDLGQALHSFGHRAESMMVAAWSRGGLHRNLWELFTRHEAQHPGRAQVGTVHFAPNSTADYDIGNQRLVPSAADDWLAFPNLAGAFRPMNCSEWGCDELGHMLWWLKHLPHVAGRTEGVSNNWWEYIVDPDIV